MIGRQPNRPPTSWSLIEKAQDDLRKAELSCEHVVADADLFDEKLAFELKASQHREVTTDSY